MLSTTKVASGIRSTASHDHTKDDHLCELTRDDLENYRAFSTFTANACWCWYGSLGDDHGW